VKELQMVNLQRRLLTTMIALSVVVPVVAGAAPLLGQETVFVMSNNVEKNQVIAFERKNDGSYFEKNRFDTLGRGSGGVNDPLESQGSLTLNADHTVLFAANAGSGNITVFRVLGGSLWVTDKEPSGGSQPVSIAEWGNTIYVLNSGGAGNVTAFRLNGSGQLHPIANATTFLSANATGGSSISVSPDGETVAVVERIAGNIDTFHVNADGTLSAAVVNPSTGAGAFSARFAPDGKLIVSETGPANEADGSAISSYTVLPNGKLAGSKPERADRRSGELLERDHSGRKARLRIQRRVIEHRRLHDRHQWHTGADRRHDCRVESRWQHQPRHRHQWRREVPLLAER
jgi:6-phosphogluconolactonase